MLVCGNCGTQNQLGRVFCSQCGGKLDLSAMTSQAVADSVRPSWWSRNWRRIVVVVAALLLALAGLALWPSSRPIGDEGKPVTGGRLQKDVAMLDRVPKGQTMSRTFTEEGINGYFEFVAKRELKDSAVSVDVMDGWCRVKVVRNFGKLPLKFYTVDIRMSFELKCSANGGRLFVRGVKMGHLPMFAPFKTMIVRLVHARISGLKEWKILTALSEIKMADGKISVVYKK